MTPQSPTLSLRTVERIAAVPEADWDACAGTANPFVRHAFLLALEESGSVTRAAGWQPIHLLAEEATPGAGKRLVGAVPLYLKGHSYGEYVFDHGWAAAFERAGGRYYPKLQAAVPFTPATGPRLLVREDPTIPREAVEDALIEGLRATAEQLGVSSVHVTFPTAREWERMGSAGWLQRTGIQYHWENRGYAAFEDFLGDLASRKRKAIRKERAQVAAQNVRLATLRGADIRPRHWDAFHRFYLDTVDRKWAHAYLTREFFARIGETMGERVVLVTAEDDGTLVAGALNLMGADALYGRNWGGRGHYPFLHFEACYYRAIDFAIETGLARVEAGAQGEHKIQRGYLPRKTHSAHWIAHPGLARAVADALSRERPAIDRTIADLMGLSPFRQGGGDEG